MGRQNERATAVMQRFLHLNQYLRQYSQQMDERGIRPREFSVLRYLWEEGPATVGQIQEYLYRSASTASSVIALLEERGFVTRTRSQVDNRVVIVELTQTGRKIAQTAPMGGIPLLRRRLPDLPETQLTAIEEALDLLMHLMEVEKK